MCSSNMCNLFCQSIFNFPQLFRNYLTPPVRIALARGRKKEVSRIYHDVLLCLCLLWFLLVLVTHVNSCLFYLMILAGPLSFPCFLIHSKLTFHLISCCILLPPTHATWFCLFSLSPFLHHLVLLSFLLLSPISFLPLKLNSLKELYLLSPFLSIVS